MWWLVLKILVTLIPAIIRAVREGQIKSAAQEEVLKGLKSRIEDAKRAEGNAVDESSDPNNRDNGSR